MSLKVPEVKLATKTEYGRNKVELKPGKGLMDWIRLASTKRLASVTLPFVDHEELMRHTKEDDCWILLFNNVYDVTSYLEYHPGGVEELMRGAGTDASDLFNEYHMWVNYNSMLKSCLVGPFQGNKSKLPKAKDAPTTTIQVPKQTSGDILKEFGISVSVKNAQIHVTFSKFNISPDNVCVCAQDDQHLRILIRPYDMPSTSMTFEKLTFGENYAYDVAFTGREARISFDPPSILNGCSQTPSQISKDSTPIFYKYQIEKIIQINHNCYLYRLVSPQGIYCPIPMGHHVIARLTKKGNVITRPYTPIAAKCELVDGNMRTRLKFLIKIYHDGIFTPELAKLKEGDSIELSEPNNRADVQKLSDAPNVVMLAAGSGITPMVHIIQHRHQQKRFPSFIHRLLCEKPLSFRASTLFFFNRKRMDVIDGALFNFSALEEGHLVVKHVLSDESEVKDGELKGRVSGEMLKANLDSFRDTQFFVCGPEGFNIVATKSLEECGVPKSRVHVFC